MCELHGPLDQEPLRCTHRFCDTGLYWHTRSSKCCSISRSCQVWLQGRIDISIQGRDPFAKFFEVLLPSPRNPPSTNLSLMHQTNCAIILHASEVLPVVKGLVASSPGLHCAEIPTFQDMLDSQSPAYTFYKNFTGAQNEPIVVLHSSGSTGKF
jgi:hypothetical protein